MFLNKRWFWLAAAWFLFLVFLGPLLVSADSWLAVFAGAILFIALVQVTAYNVKRIYNGEDVERTASAVRRQWRRSVH